jgi:hypothetical protein
MIGGWVRRNPARGNGDDRDRTGNLRIANQSKAKPKSHEKPLISRLYRVVAKIAIRFIRTRYFAVFSGVAASEFRNYGGVADMPPRNEQVRRDRRDGTEGPAHANYQYR